MVVVFLSNVKDVCVLTCKHCVVFVLLSPLSFLFSFRYIDVWDGESLMRIGTVAIDLRQLMRQGEPYTKNALEYDVISSEENGISLRGHAASGGSLSNTVHARALPAGALVGRVQLLTSCYGVPGKGPHDEESDRKAAMGGRAANSAATASGLDGQSGSSRGGSGAADWRLGVPPSLADPSSGAKHRVRARPLTSSNPELRALIKSRHQAYDLGESRAISKERRREWSEGMSDVRALTDGMTISTSELDQVLERCELFINLCF